MGDDGDFGREALDVFRFLRHETHGNEKGEICVLDARLLETCVQLSLNILPDRIPIGTDDHRPLDGAVIDELRLDDDVGVPLGEIRLDIRDLRNELIFCHNRSKIRYRTL